MKRTGVASGLLAAILLLHPPQLTAAPITYSLTSGSLAASVTFDTSGTDLLVTLVNTSLADALVPMDILTAVFFDIIGNPTLTRTSAVLSPGSTVLFGTTDPGGVVGGEWSYRGGGSTLAYGASQGISSSGLGVFGSSNRFPGHNLQGPKSPDGVQYGITSAGDNPATGNTPVTGENALIQNSVFFTLGGLASGFDPSLSIDNVTFQYGTSLIEPHVSVPEPTSLLLFGVALLLAIPIVRKKRGRAGYRRSAM